jgi:hypothetical protein
MSERRGPRLVVEVGFLAALAAASTFANLRSYEIAGVMLLGWVCVAVFEWGALRSRAHYGSGLPPRWYVPQFTLPPPRPLEQFSAGYPSEPSAGEATWIASPAMLADWPVADEPVAAHERRVEEETQVHDVLEVEMALMLAEPEVEPELEPEPAPQHAAPRAVGMSKHRIDPLAEPPQKGRRFGRRVDDEALYAEVPNRPSGSRLLPSQSRSED